MRGDRVQMIAESTASAAAAARRGRAWPGGSGSIEADYLNGEISLLGRLHGVPTPANDVLQRLANEFARDRRPPGSLPLPDLIAAIDAAAAETRPG